MTQDGACAAGVGTRVVVPRTAAQAVEAAVGFVSGGRRSGCQKGDDGQGSW